MPEPSNNTATQIREPAPHEVQTPAQLIVEASVLRYESGELHRDATNVHQRIRRHAIDERTAQAAKRAPGQLLKELSQDWGLSWALIARLTGVSATAVRKWRRGEPMLPDNRRSVARLVAFLEICESCSSPIQEPASWLEMPLSGEATITPADLFLAGKESLLLDLVSEQVTPQTALDRFDPSWRESHGMNSNFEVVESPDGLPTIAERR